MKMPELPPLPALRQGHWAANMRTDEQMQAYARAYGELVRQECAKVCRDLTAFDMDDPGESAAAAILRPG